VLWLLPFNYIWLVQLLGDKREYAPANHGHEFDHASQDWKPVDSTEVKVQELRSAGPQGSLRQRKPILFWTSVAIGFIAILQWIMTLVSVIQHWQYTWSNNPRTQTYLEVPSAAVGVKGDPSTIAPAMPRACLNWLMSGNLEKSGLINVNTDQFMMVLVTTMQLLFCSLVLFKGLKQLLGFGASAMQSSYRRTFGMLKLSALATLVTLGLPALITGMWIVGFVIFGSQDVQLRYTTDPSVTGGCTFGFVNMDKRWGYWDVQYELPTRIIMSIFGAA
jgi:hypothetical protein